MITQSALLASGNYTSPVEFQNASMCIFQLKKMRFIYEISKSKFY